MANVAVVGAQWGDEGKGKIVDWLSLEADVVVRFQGGHNAGHTLVIDGVTYKLALLPSGIVRPGKLSVIGNGVVVDPHFLVGEIERLREQGVAITPAKSEDRRKRAADSRRSIANSTRYREESASEGVKIGTTKRGIGPAYEDKVGRRAIRLVDLAEPDTLDDKIARTLAHHNPLRRGLGLPEIASATPARGASERRAARFCPSWRPSGDCSRTSGAPASESCSRARRACCSTSITAPTLT